jgi:hypothetical protein
VTLQVTNQQGNGDSASHDVDVAAPALATGINVVGATKVRPGDMVDVHVVVSASADGVGDLTGIHFATGFEPGLTAGPTGVAAVTDGPDAALPSVLHPGDEVTLDFKVQAGDTLGRAALQTKIEGEDASGNTVSQDALSHFDVSNQALTVKITPSKNDFKLESDDAGNPKPQTIDVAIDVTNVSDADVDTVTVSPLVLAAADPLHVYEPFPATVVLPNDDDSVGLVVAHQTQTVKRQVTVTGDGFIKLSSTVLSDDGMALGAGQLRVGVTTMLVEEISGDPSRTAKVGDPVTIRGRFENVTNDRTVAVYAPSKVLRDGNLLGGGYIARADGDNLTAEFPEPLVQTLKPGESVDFQVRFTTERPSIADYDEGTQDAAKWTQAKVSFFLGAHTAVQEDDGTWSSLSTSESTLSKYPSSVKLTGIPDGNVQYTIDTTEPFSGQALATRIGDSAFGFTVGGLEEAQQHALDLFRLLGDAGAFAINPEFRDEVLTKVLANTRVQEALTYVSNVATWLPQADMDEVVGAVAQRVHDAYSLFEGVVVDGAPQLAVATAEALEDQLRGTVLHLQGSWRRGDPNELADAFAPLGGLVGGAATDLLLPEALFRGLTITLSAGTRYLALAADNWSQSRTIQSMLNNLPDAARQTIELAAAKFSKSVFPDLERAYIEQRALADTELGVGTTGDNGAGLSKDTSGAGRQWSKDNPNKIVVVIPNEANVAALRDAGLAVGKIENIKPKSMASIEKLVFGGRDEDLTVVVLRNLKWTDAQVDSRIDELIAGGLATDDDRVVAKQILHDRQKEWAVFKARGDVIKDPVTGEYVPKLDANGKIVQDSDGIGKLAAADEIGSIPNQFRGVDNGLTVSGPEQSLGFKLDYLDQGTGLPATAADSDYVVLKLENPKTQELVKVTGDDDGIFIGSVNGLGLDKSLIDDAYLSIMHAFNHPFTDTWLASLDKKLKIFSKYMTTIPGEGVEGKPLVAFVNGEAFAVKINPYETRFDLNANRARIAFEGLPEAVDPVSLAQQQWFNALTAPVRPFVWPASMLRLFLHQTNAADHPAPVIPTAKSGPVVRINSDMRLETWTTSTGWRVDPAAEALAGQWQLAVAPQTQLLSDTAAGASRVEVNLQSDLAMAGDWFGVGDRVVIDAGGPNEEMATVAGFGSLIFSKPLTKPHGAGEIVADVSGLNVTVTGGSVQGGKMRPFRLDGLARRTDNAALPCSSTIDVQIGSLNVSLQRSSSSNKSTCSYVAATGKGKPSLTLDFTPSTGAWSVRGPDLPATIDLTAPVIVGLTINALHGSTAVRFALKGASWVVQPASS